MKKTIAAGGVGVLGLSAAALGVAAPAHAEPVVGPACDDNGGHNPSSTPLANWFTECVPQYAVAPVYFDLVSDVPFPDEFQNVFDGTVAVSTSAGAAAADAYFNLPPGSNGVVEWYQFAAEAQRQSYGASFALPVLSAGSATAADLPAACAGATYTGIYQLTYAPTTVSFTKTIDGEEWRYDVVLAPPPLTLGLNLVDGIHNPDAAVCASAGDDVLFGADAESGDWFAATEIASASITATLTPYFGEGKSLPDVSRYVAPPEPALPATGVSPAVPIGAAAILLGLGAGALAIARRRRVS